jgi:hypothetical protein
VELRLVGWREIALAVSLARRLVGQQGLLLAPKTFYNETGMKGGCWFV